MFDRVQWIYYRPRWPDLTGVCNGASDAFSIAYGTPTHIYGYVLYIQTRP